MTYTPPFHFDGHGVNDAQGQRICKVTSCEPYIDGNKRNREFDELSNLIAAAPIGYELADAIIAQANDGLDRSEWILNKAKEFMAIAKAEGRGAL